MKVKLSGFDPKAFFVNHIEKVVLAGVVGVVLMLVWQAVSLEVYKKTPAELTQQAQQLTQTVSAADWNSYLKENLEKAVAPAGAAGAEAPAAEGEAAPAPEDRPLVPVDYLSRAVAARQPIPTLPIAPHNPPIEPTLMKRREPELFAPLNLEANVGAGSIALYVDPTARPGVPGAESGEPGRRPKAARPGEETARRPSAADRAREKKKRAAESAAYAAQMMGSGSGYGDYPGAVGPSGSPEGDVPVSMQGSGTGMSGSGYSSFGNAQPKGYRWVCITAPVPITKQQLEFFDKLGLTSQTIRPTDYVKYANFEVQYAEVPNDRAKPAEGDWKPVDVNKLVEEMDTWADVEAPEVVNQMVTDPALTAWLPPRLDRTWGEDVVHSEFLDFMLSTNEMLDEQMKAAKEAAEEKPTEEEPAAGASNPFLRDRINNRRRGGMNGMVPPSMDYQGSGYGSGYGASPEAGVAAAGSDYVMFRFFHFFVEEGKHYTYRVRLSLNNPNYMQPANSLENPEAAKTEFVTTPWSEPSPTVSIPKSGNLLVSGLAKNEKGGQVPIVLSKETEVGVIVRQWDKDTGVVAAKYLTMARGRAGLFPKTADVDYQDPATRKPGKKEVNFETGLQLVDFIGGGKLRHRSLATDPVDHAFIDETGNLVLRSELADRPTFTVEEESIKKLQGGATAAGPPNPYDDFNNGLQDPFAVPGGAAPNSGRPSRGRGE